jgi:uncharacterized protein
MEHREHRIESIEQLRSLMGEPNPLTQKKVFRALDQTAIGFIKRSPFIVLSTADADGNQDASPKGDGPGFVVVENEHTLLIPERKGNKLVFGLGNILQNPQVGIIFMVPGTNETLRVNGTAELTKDPALLDRMAARGGAALLATRVTVNECFFHCAKAFLRSQLWKPETWPEREQISFGKMLAATVGGDQGMAAQIDKSIEQDYKTNL